MKLKFLAACLLGAALSASAQGYKDGIEYYKAGQFANAIDLLQRNMNGADTDKALSQYYLGQSFLAQGDKAAALKAFEAGVAANAECAYNYVGLGALELLANGPKAAKEYFKKAQGLDKKNAEVMVDIARAYYNADPTAYAKEIEELVAKARKTSKNQEPAIYIFEGDRLAKDKQWGDAATQYEQAITFDQGNPEGYVKYANVYFNIEPQYALNKLSELLSLSPNSALGQRELAEKYYLADQWSKAAQQYGDYINNPNHFPQDEARYSVLLYAGSQYDKAVDVARKVLAVDPTNFQVQRIIVRSLTDLKKNDEALKEAKNLFSGKFDSQHFNSSDFTNYAMLLDADSLYSEAGQVLDQGLKTFPKDLSLLQAAAHHYSALKDMAKSVDYTEAYLNANPNPELYEYLNAAIDLLGAANNAKDDLAARRAFADRGIKVVDKATADMAPSQSLAKFLRIKGLLAVVGNNFVADQLTADTFGKVIDVLNADPANADPNNEKNLINYYIQAYDYIGKYNAAQKNAEGMKAAQEKMAQYESLLKK